MLVERVRETIRRHRLIEPGSKVLVAVSGGADSVALLHVLLALRAEMGLGLAVAHLDHGLRPDSARDAEWVEALGRRHGLPCVVERADLSADEAEDGLQDLARRARYAFLARAAAAAGARAVAVGHHADDQVETVLLGLVRGAGVVSGMPIRRPLGGGAEVVRPMLEVSRGEVMAYLRLERIEFRDDPSNASERFLRNRVRARLVPFLLEHFNSRLREHVLGLAAALRDDDVFLEAAAAEAYPRAVRPAAGGLALDLEALGSLAPAVRRRVLRRAVREAGAPAGGAEAGMEHVAALLDLAEGGRTGARVDLPGGLRAERTRASVILAPAPAGGPAPVRCEIAVPGETVVGPLGVVVEATVIPRGEGVVALRHGDRTAVLDADSVRPPLVVRTRLPGDRLAPLGMPGTKKLQDLLVDAKVPRGVRDRVPIVADAEGVIWVVGVREGDRCRVTDRTRRCLRLEVRDLAPAGGSPEAAA